jgi:hypothetical protein
MAVKRDASSGLLADLRIILLGTWGFLRQCLKSWASTTKRPHELESGK